MSNICEYCKKYFEGYVKDQRFCNFLCQRKHYNRRPEIREKHRIRILEYRKNHPEWREKHRLQQAKYKERNQRYRREYFQRPEVKTVLRNRARELRNNPEYAIADRLRRSLRHALTKYSKKRKIMNSKKYGIDWKEIIDHLKPFPENLRNYEIDHIIPLRTFNLTNDNEIKRAFSSQNLRWLTKAENRSKGGKNREE